MISIRFRTDRTAEFDPEIQVEIDPRLDFIPVNVPMSYRTRQFEFLYSEPEPLVIMEVEEEVHVNTR